MDTELSLERRAALHAALADPARLAITDALCTGDASPSELGERSGMRSNLIAHHLRVLEEAGLVTRSRSEADHRRVYIRLLPEVFGALVPAALLRAPRVVFVCTRNSARSQLAAALWRHRSPVPAASAGTRPGEGVHAGAVAAARRHGLHLEAERTAHVADVLRPDDLVERIQVQWPGQGVDVDGVALLPVAGRVVGEVVRDGLLALADQIGEGLLARRSAW